YLRFPSDGVISDITYEVTSTVDSRTGAIAEFLAQASAALRPMGVSVSADIFGLVPSVGGGRDLGIGQRLEDIAAQVDYISPMVYPTTFGKGNLGIDDPVNQPYEIVYKSCINARARTATKLRPWLQHYWGDAEYYVAQRQAATDAGSYGWMFWNAGGRYNEEGLFAPDPAPDGSGDNS
ncbi:MAG: putative glycoside hydrolase, partial [Anaerolineae bacterium]